MYISAPCVVLPTRVVFPEALKEWITRFYLLSEVIHQRHRYHRRTLHHRPQHIHRPLHKHRRPHNHPQNQQQNQRQNKAETQLKPHSPGSPMNYRIVNNTESIKKLKRTQKTLKGQDQRKQIAAPRNS